MKYGDVGYNIAKVIKDDFEDIIFTELSDSILDYIQLRSTPVDEPNPDKGSGSLRSGSGDLAKSLRRGGKDNIAEIDYGKNRIRIRFGSELIYAPVQEKGMRIHSKGKMDSYFWARYYASGKTNDFMKASALKVMKKGYVDIPGRPFLEPGLKDFVKSNLTKILVKIYDKTLKDIFREYSKEQSKHEYRR